MTRRVAVLMGGWSAEREVSLVSGKAVGKALGEAGFDVELVDVGRDIATVLDDIKPDVAFNALHGRYGEDGLIQGVLEILQIPYTHSGVLASALAMDKPVARTLFEAAGMRCAEGMVLTRRQLIDGQGFEPPYVVKPINEGSSVGVRLVFEGDNFHFEDDTAWTFGDQVLIERYIAGKEIQVAVMGDRALGAIEIRPHGRFYDYEAKYTDDKARHLMPAPIGEAAYEEALRLGLLIHQTLGCRGVSRADLRYDDTGDDTGDDSGDMGGTFYVLETNTQPGMTPLSLVPEIAAYQGIDFTELVTWMVEDASCDR